jgi:hypothetical protein
MQSQTVPVGKTTSAVKNLREKHRNINPVVHALIVPPIKAVTAAINPVLPVLRRAVSEATDRVPLVLRKVAAGQVNHPAEVTAKRVLPDPSEVVDKGKSRLDDKLLSFKHKGENNENAAHHNGHYPDAKLQYLESDCQ